MLRSELRQMSLKELLELKHQWIEDATKSKKFSKLFAVLDEFGTNEPDPQRPGETNYLWDKPNNFLIREIPNGEQVECFVKGKLVVRSGSNTLWVRGEWEEILEAWYQKVVEKRSNEQYIAEEKEREALISELCEI